MRIASLFAAAAVLALAASARADDLDTKIPAPLLDPANAATSETVVLAGGCFWGQQAVFEHVKGVTRVVAGYSCGAKETASRPEGNLKTTDRPVVETGKQTEGSGEVLRWERPLRTYRGIGR